MNPIKNGIITTPFEEMRPLSAPPEKRNHVHGALDISPRGDNTIYAPVSGYVWGYKAKRDPSFFDKDGNPVYRMFWPQMPIIHGRPFPWCNYFYDMYGGVIVIEETDDRDEIVRTHLICHSYQNQIFNLHPLSSVDSHTIEEKKDKRGPIDGIYTDKCKFRAGDKIGAVGNAGYSTGHHIHWEIHPGRSWVKHDLRVHPREYL